MLDEPTSGLDPLKEAVFQACIEEMREAGRTVLLSSHILAEVEALCDRVTIIRAGKTVETGTLSELRHLTRTSIAVETMREPAGLDQLPGVHDAPRRGPPRPLRRRHRPSSTRPCAGSSGFGVRSLTSTPPTLEELFLRHYGDEIEDEPE